MVHGAAIGVGVNSSVANDAFGWSSAYTNSATAMVLPTAMPAIAPAAVMPRHQMASTMTGVSADPATANAQVTIVATAEGNSADSDDGSRRNATTAATAAV